MTSTVATGSSASAPGFLSKERIIARPGFNRWLVPPAALAIHLCIGMAYGFRCSGCLCRKPLASPPRLPVRQT